MNDISPKQRLNMARQDLIAAREALIRLRETNPGAFADLLPRFLSLSGRQMLLENMMRTGESKSRGELGQLIPLAIIAGVTLLGGTGFWAFKHHEETSQFKSYVECLDRMQKIFQSEGMSPGEAAQRAASVCGGPRRGLSLFGLDVTQLIMVGGLGLAVYLLFKK